MSVCLSVCLFPQKHRRLYCSSCWASRWWGEGPLASSSREAWATSFKRNYWSCTPTSRYYYPLVKNLLLLLLLLLLPPLIPSSVTSKIVNCELLIISFSSIDWWWLFFLTISLLPALVSDCLCFLLQPYVRVVLIEGTPTILSMFDQFLQAAAIDTLRDRNVDLRLKAKVTRIEKNKVLYCVVATSTSSLLMWSDPNQIFIPYPRQIIISRTSNTHTIVSLCPVWTSLYLISPQSCSLYPSHLTVSRYTTSQLCPQGPN